MAGKQRYSDKYIISALRKSKGMVYVAAAAIGCSPNTIKKRIETSAAVRAAAEHEYESAVDNAELALFRAVLRGEAWAVQFMLKTKGKNRGYVERTEKQVDVVIKREATRVAERYGLEADALIAEAERILAESADEL